jgi:acyl carrier protein
MDEKLSKLIDQIAEQFDNELEVERDTITGETSFKDVVYWDSMGVLCIMAMLEDNYNISITGLQIQEELNTFNDLINLIYSNK